MGGRTKTEAFEDFREMVQEVVSCFADARVARTMWDENGRGILTANGSQRQVLPRTEWQSLPTCSSATDSPDALRGQGLWRRMASGCCPAMQLRPSPRLIFLR